jgi:hypothetical protein
MSHNPKLVKGNKPAQFSTLISLDVHHKKCAFCIAQGKINTIKREWKRVSRYGHVFTHLKVLQCTLPAAFSIRTVSGGEKSH